MIARSTIVHYMFIARITEAQKERVCQGLLQRPIKRDTLMNMKTENRKLRKKEIMFVLSTLDTMTYPASH